MKKLIAVIAAFALALAFGTASFAAETSACRRQCDDRSVSCRYVDKNSDGKCDNCGVSCRYVDKNGDGVCDNCGSRSNSGSRHGGGRHGKRC